LKEAIQNGSGELLHTWDNRDTLREPRGTRMFWLQVSFNVEGGGGLGTCSIIQIFLNNLLLF